MKRLGLPSGKAKNFSRAFAAFVAAIVIAGCSSKAGPIGQGAGAGAGIDVADNSGGDGLLSGSGADQEGSSIVQGAFDQSNQDLSQTQAPGSVSNLSQQQTTCSSASSSSSQGFDLFQQLSRPDFYGSANACFTNQFNPTQLLSQSYTFMSVMAQCQRIALNQVNQVAQTPENILTLMYWATGFILECAQRSTLLETNYAYATPLMQGINIRQTAMRSASNRLRIAIRERSGQ